MNYDMLVDAMKFIEQHSYDKYFYTILDLNGAQTEVMLERGNKSDKPWKYKDKIDYHHEAWRYCNFEDIIRLADTGNQAKELFRTIYATCMSNLMFADLVVQDLTKIFGVDNLQKARKANADFADALQTTIAKALVKQVDGEGQTTEPKMGHLRIVKDDICTE